MFSFKRASRQAALLATIVLLGCGGSDGKDGKDGKNGENGAPGPTGTAGPQGPEGPEGPTGDAGLPLLKNDVSGTVTDSVNPLAGVTVSVEPGSATAQTDAAGKFTLSKLDIGAYIVTFHLDGYLDQVVPVAVNIGGPTTLNASLSGDPTSGIGPAVTVSDQLSVGFGQPVTIKATATGSGLTYAWKQVGGQDVALTGGTTDTLQFTTLDFAKAMGTHTTENARLGVLGINPDQAGNYVFELTVTDPAGRVTVSRVHVDSTRATSGIRMVPIGVPVWLQGDGQLANQTTWNWTMTAAAGSTATIQNPTSQFPSFIPDKDGTYTITETVSGKPAFKVYAGTWLGEMTDASESTCVLCHTGAIAPKKFEAWKGTKHYGALKAALDGDFGPDFTEEHFRSFTLGYDKLASASNNGFDDVEATSTWKFPATLQSGNFATLAADQKLGPLAGIQCESCHGPQTSTASPHMTSAGNPNADIAARISWSADVCSKCHQDNPMTYKSEQWAESKHASLDLALEEATVEGRGTTAAHCGRCHSAQGYAQYVKQLKQGYSGNLTSDGKPPAAGSPSPNAATLTSLTALGLTQATVQSQTCAACHDPHDATNPAQLRIYDSVAALPNGMTNISGAGAGMVCMSCHNTRNGEHNDFQAPLTSYSAPHAAAQTDVVFGFNAYFVPRYNLSKHLAVKDSCAGCHYGVATSAEQMAKQTSNHSFAVDNTICAACHSSNVNGEALQAGYQMQLDALGKTLAGKVLNLVNNALAPANGGGYTARVWDPVSDNYSSTSASNVALTVAPTSISHFEIHGSFGFIFHMPAPMAINLVNTAGAAAGSINTADVYIPAGNLKNAAGTTALFPASSDYTKALWNLYLLEDDGTKGIHNPDFYDTLIATTNAKAAALP